MFSNNQHNLKLVKKMQRKRYPHRNTVADLARWSKVQISSFTEGLFFPRNKQTKKKKNHQPLVKKGLNSIMMTNNAIKELSGSLVFTQELSEGEMCK